MRASLLTCLLACLPVLAAAPRALAQDEATPVYDFGDAGGVVVVDTGPPMGRQAVVQNDVPAEPGGFWYYGPHPDGQGGWDPTVGAHQHEYPPFDEYLFTQENGYYYFIGDPADFGYPTDDLYNYYGVHPIALAYGGGYCYYPGYHHHWWRPFGGFFVPTDGWYWYNGPFSPWFYVYRDRYDRYWRDVYPRRIHLAQPPSTHIGRPPAGGRPQVTVAAPIQRLRSPAAPARAGFAYVHPARPNVVRAAAPRPMAAPARLTPARGAPARAAPGRRH